MTWALNDGIFFVVASAYLYFVLFDFLIISCNQEDLKDEIDVKVDLSERGMSAEKKVKEQNRIRKMAMRAREKMPKDYPSFCLVAAHLVKNAHRYYPESQLKEIKKEEKEVSPAKSDPGDVCKHVNQKLREICNLK